MSVDMSVDTVDTDDKTDMVDKTVDATDAVDAVDAVAADKTADAPEAIVLDFVVAAEVIGVVLPNKLHLYLAYDKRSPDFEHLDFLCLQKLMPKLRWLTYQRVI